MIISIDPILIMNNSYFVQDFDDSQMSTVTDHRLDNELEAPCVSQETIKVNFISFV